MRVAVSRYILSGGKRVVDNAALSGCNVAAIVPTPVALHPSISRRTTFRFSSLLASSTSAACFSFKQDAALVLLPGAPAPASPPLRARCPRGTTNCQTLAGPARNAAWKRGRWPRSDQSPGASPSPASSEGQEAPQERDYRHTQRPTEELASRLRHEQGGGVHTSRRSTRGRVLRTLLRPERERRRPRFVRLVRTGCLRLHAALARRPGTCQPSTSRAPLA